MIFYTYSAAVRYAQNNVKDENQMDALKLFTEKIEGLACHSDGKYPAYIPFEDLVDSIDSWKDSLKELDYMIKKKG